MYCFSRTSTQSYAASRSLIKYPVYRGFRHPGGVSKLSCAPMATAIVKVSAGKCHHLRSFSRGNLPPAPLRGRSFKPSTRLSKKRLRLFIQVCQSRPTSEERCVEFQKQMPSISLVKWYLSRVIHGLDPKSVDILTFFCSPCS